jgi:uncharacterized membrane protein YphA (DoxX/SURF4 family)
VIRIVSAGHFALAAVMVALGILGLATGDFTPVWQTGPPGLPGREALAYLTAVVALAGGLGLLWERAAALAARVLFCSFLLWLLVFNLPEVFPAPAVVGNWFGCSTTAVMVAAAWVLYVWLANAWDRRRLGFVSHDGGLRIARVLYGLALVHFGIAHFVYLHETVVLVPRWLSSPVAWAHFTGGAYIAAGVAVIIGVLPRLAAALAAVQIAGFTLLVWWPIVAAGSRDPFQVSETLLSTALTAAAWVIADSYRTLPWLAVNRR